MADQATETPTNQTEGAVSTEAAAGSLLTGEPAATTEQQPGDVTTGTAKPAEGAAAAEAKTDGAPEAYTFVAPEGKAYDSAVLESFSGAAKAANLTQDAAQKLLESMAPTLAERQQEQVKAIQSGWAEASKTDKEFGGDKLQENLAVAKKAMTAYASPELRTLLDETGLGNHPEVIRMLLKVGQSISEDGFVAGQRGAPSVTSVADALYDKTPKK